MLGFLVFCFILIIVFRKAKKENAQNKKRRKTLFESKEKTHSVSPKDNNRALKSMRQSSGGEKENKVKEMPIEQRRKQQKEASDRSRIHQSLHEKERKTKEEKQEKQEKLQTEMPVVREEIRFEDGQLMNEVYAIMACGYPPAGSGQRDFLKEGMELLDRYHCA